MQISNNLPIINSYLGARICYSSKHPVEILLEEKVQDKEKLVDFLMKLYKAQHYSIFSHTPVIINTENFSIKEKLDLATNYFKVFIQKNKAILNLRHIAEKTKDKEFREILISKNRGTRGLKIQIYIEKGNWNKVFEGSIDEIKKYQIPTTEGIIAQRELIVIKDEVVQDWLVVIAHNYSRVFSHQLIRHTWINFNQRSHRYTAVDRFVLPPEIETEDEKQHIIKILEHTYNEYKTLKDRGVKKEVARYIIPQAVATTVICSAPIFVWNDFINKRIIPQAQKEIREFAKILQTMIN